MAFELVTKPIQYSDLATKMLKRKSDKIKNEMMREMIQTCIHNSLKFRFVLMDSWIFQSRPPCKAGSKDMRKQSWWSAGSLKTRAIAQEFCIWCAAT